MSDFDITDQNRVRRVPERGVYDKATVYAIVDDALVGHVAFLVDDQPFVIPTLIARAEDDLLIHGATSSRLMRRIEAGTELAVAVTHVDGIVLARSIFHHSINYRSAILFGSGTLITDPDQKLAALRVFSDRLLPGRWADAREPNDRELKATAVAKVSINLASAKVRSGPPGDDEDDYGLPVWAGVLPIRQLIGQPVPDERLYDEIDLPQYIRQYRARFNAS